MENGSWKLVLLSWCAFPIKLTSIIERDGLREVWSLGQRMMQRVSLSDSGAEYYLICLTWRTFHKSSFKINHGTHVHGIGVVVCECVSFRSIGNEV